MEKAHDIDPFPIQADHLDRTEFPACSIPNWLATLAHREYTRRGHNQSAQDIARRGGFGRAELVALIRGEYTAEGLGKAQTDLNEGA